MQPNKAIVGKNAFAHEAGIHQDGFLKERTTYEIMDPRVGRRSCEPARRRQAQRTPRHPRSLPHLGFKITSEQLEAIYHQVISVCDKKKWLSDQEIGDIARSVVQA